MCLVQAVQSELQLVSMELEFRWVHTCNVTAYCIAVTLQVTNTIRNYDLNFHPVPQGVTVSSKRYTRRFPVCYGCPSDVVFAASSGFVHLYTLHFKEREKKRRWWKRQLYTSREVYSGSSLLAHLNFQSVSGLYKNFTRMSPSEFEFLINLIGEKISKKDTSFRKATSVQERLALTLRFLASGDSYVSLQ
jgi:hypothetical protein